MKTLRLRVTMRDVVPQVERVIDVPSELYNLAHQLQALDLISRTRSEWSAGPSARSPLPGANLLADLL